MQGGRTRDFIVPRAVLVTACAALTAMIAAPLALAGSPATDQYGSALPGGGNGGAASNSGGSAGGSGSSGQATIPVASDSGSGATSADSTEGAAGRSGDTSTGSGGKGDGASKGSGSSGSTSSEHRSVVGENASANSVPEIASSTAGDSWVPFFIAGLLALALAATGALVYRHRRRAAQS
jgi:hypothetical protein